MMTALWFVGGLILTVVGLTCSIGAVLPRDHVATGSVVVQGSPTVVWQTIRHVAAAPSWRPSVTKVEVIDQQNGVATRWTEHGPDGALTMIVDEEASPHRVVTRIDDAGLPFGGTWTIELTEESGDTRARVTERGFIKLPPVRVLAKLFMDPNATLRRYLKDLAAKHGGSGAVEP